MNLSRKNCIAHKQKNFNDEINNFFRNSHYSKIRNYVTLMRSLNAMEELKKFQSSTFDTIARRRLVEDQDTFLELTGKIQELQNEINCMNDSRDFQDAESVCSGNSHVTSQPVSFSHPIPEGMLSRSIRMSSRREGPPWIWDTWYIGNVFLQIQLRVLFITLSAGIESMEFRKRRADSLINSGNRVWNKHKFKIRDASLDSQPKVLSSFVRETLSKNYGADQQRRQISDLHFDKFPTPATLACWKISFKIEVCTCSQFRTEAMHWIKEVEMVDSV